MTQSWAHAARLVRCTGFGATGAEVDAAAAISPEAYVDDLFAPAAIDAGVVATPVPDFVEPPALARDAGLATAEARSRELGLQSVALLSWWLTRMAAVGRAFPERLTLAWHGIFATSIDKVRSGKLMADQNATLRAEGAGDFRTLALSMLTDAAMIVWLDNQTNTKASPNENLAREFMELFALGHGNGYTEDDVHNGARALSGWNVDRTTGLATPVPARHDDGVKTVLGVTGRLDHVGFLDAVLAQRKSAPFVLGRMWNQLVSDQPMNTETSRQVVTAYSSTRDLRAAITAMLTGTGFSAAAGTRVVPPVEWAVGLARAVGASADAATAAALTAAVRTLGQVPFHPSSVGGWPSGQAWLSAATVDARWTAAHHLIALGHLDSVAAASPNARLDVTAHLLGIATWSDRSAAALRPFTARPADLVAAAAMTPEYLTV